MFFFLLLILLGTVDIAVLIVVVGSVECNSWRCCSS